MAVRKRGSKWQVDVQVGKQRYRKSFSSEEAAIEVEKKVIERLEKGLDPDPPIDELGPITFEKLVKKAIERYWRGSKNERTAVINANAAVEFFGKDIQPSKITTIGVDDYLGYLRGKGNSDSTINRKMSALSKVLEFGFSRGWINELPTFERLPENKSRVRWYKDEELDRIYGQLSKTGEEDFAEVVLFLEQTGARASEAARLECQDVNLDQRIVSLYKTKSDRPRSVPLSNKVFEMLAKRLSRIHPSAQHGTLVFPGWLDKDERTSPMTDAWRTAARGAKIDGRMHDLRHTFASRLIQRGARESEIQLLLGHSSIQMTMIYSHLAPKNLRSAIDLMDDVTTSGQNPQSQAFGA